MNTVKQDRAELKRLVESYGKADVVKFVKHLNEEYSDVDPNFGKAFSLFMKMYESVFGKQDNNTVEHLKYMARSVYIDGYTNSYKDHNTSNTSSDDNFDNINDVEDIIASLQEPVASVFAKLGVQFKQFISEDYELDDNGYVYLYPDTLWNGSPVEDDFIRKNWMPRKDDIILAPALLINPETEDIIFLVGYEDEDNDQVEYKVQYSSEVEFARDFVRMFNYAKNHHETYDQIICHLMKGARKL